MVNEIDKATSPLAKKQITLDAVPPGAHPTKITPIPIICSILKDLTNKKPNIGIIKNCNKIPKQTILKFLKIFRKSSIVKVNPMENITTLNKGTIRKLISVQYWGFKKAQAENKITQRGNNLIVLATKFFIENYKILQT